MRVARRDGSALIALDDGPLINFCRPAVDPLFSSAAEVWGARNLAVVLTGMGSDGARGAADIVAAGGSVIAQDEATSVVWGMPGAVAHAGLCSAVLPLDQIAPKVMRLFSRGAVVTPLDYDYPAQAAEGALRPRALRRQAIPGRKPAAAGRAQGRPCRSRPSSCDGSRGRRREPLATEVVEAMTTNEIVLLPRQDSVRAFPRHHHAGAVGRARGAAPHPHLVRGRLHRPGALFARHDAQGDGQRARRLAHRDRRHRSLDRGAGEGQGRHLQPVRGAARPADPAAGQVFHAGRRDLADRAGDPRHGAVPAAQPAQRFLAISACSTSCSAATC